MDKLCTIILNNLNHSLEDDLTRLDFFKNTIIDDKKTQVAARQRHLEFVKYLVSVATHPIGLRASVSPFNSSQEQMLAYIMDMFSLTGVKLEKILIGTKKSKEIGKTADRGKTGDQQTGLSAKKRHSWRPELRIRLSAPIFFYREQDYLDNLHVRVYLFREDRLVESSKQIDFESSATTTTSSDRFDKLEDTKSKSILNKIFKRFRLDSSVLIRPVKEMRHLVRFEPSLTIASGPAHRVKIYRTAYNMIQVVNSDTKIKDDIRLNLRRYYCDPKTAHILRFEFWLDARTFRTGCLNWYKRLVRRLVYTGNISSCFKRNTSTTYENENQEFYGYINIKLTQLASYATKQTYPILSLNERKVNNCQICLELKNRRILEDGEAKMIEQGQLNALSASRKSSDEYLMRHVRLYVNCLVYQSLSLASSEEIGSKSSSYEVFHSLTLDNLLYIPAYTLINQHRLQSNLNQFEDKCLRRVSILLLLVKLEQRQRFKGDDRNSKLIIMKMLLVSVIRNEYINANRLIDDKTLQEVDPFKDDTGNGGTRSSITILEIATLRKFVNLFLFNRLKKWLLSPKASDESNPDDLDRSITLSSLRMFRTAISHFKKMSLSSEMKGKIQQDATALKIRIEQLLCGLIIGHLKTYLDTLINNSLDRIKGKVEGVGKQEDKELWLELLHDIKRIDHDVCLHWSRKGLNGLIMNEREFVKKLRMFENLEKQNFRRVIMTKIDNYLG